MTQMKKMKKILAILAFSVSGVAFGQMSLEVEGHSDLDFEVFAQAIEANSGLKNVSVANFETTTLDDIEEGVSDSLEWLGSLVGLGDRSEASYTSYSVTVFARVSEGQRALDCDVVVDNEREEVTVHGCSDDEGRNRLAFFTVPFHELGVTAN